MTIETQVYVKSKKHDIYGCLINGNKFSQHKWISLNKPKDTAGDCGRFEHKFPKDCDPDDFEQISADEYATLYYKDYQKI